MKRSKLIFSFVVLVVSLLLMSGCGGLEQNTPPTNSPNENVNDQEEAEAPTNEVENPVVSDDELPMMPAEGELIVNLPGETPYQEQERGEGQGTLSSGTAYVSSTELVIMESYPVQVALEISGQLPTPCNQLTVDIAEPNADNQIHVEVYSLIDPAMTCIAVLDPFATRVSLPVENLADGTYEVWVNGTLVGEFTYPG